MRFFGVIVFLASLAMSHMAWADPLDPALCRSLIRHRPSSDVAYQPGVDVYGKKVVPADLEDGAKIELPSRFDVPVTVDLFKILTNSKTHTPFNKMGQTDINLGVLTVDGDLVSYNGKPLTDAQQENLAVLCLKPDEGTKPVSIKP
jgi:hypothetical protein